MTRVSVPVVGAGADIEPRAIGDGPPPGRRESQRAATRARLFEESVREFQRTGFATTEIAVIAARAGLSRGGFYVHFDGKDGVLRELLLVEEQRIAADVVARAGPDAPIAEVLEAIAAAVLRAEQRLGRPLTRDLCAAQFRPEVARPLDDHPVALVLVEALRVRGRASDAVDLATVFLTGLFGLLATGVGPPVERRRHIDLLVALVATRAATP